MGTKTCQRCGEEIDAKRKNCPECAKLLEEAYKRQAYSAFTEAMNSAMTLNCSPADRRVIGKAAIQQGIQDAIARANEWREIMRQLDESKKLNERKRTAYFKEFGVWPNSTEDYEYGPASHKVDGGEYRGDADPWD